MEFIKKHPALIGMIMILSSIPAMMAFGTWAFWALFISGCIVMIVAVLQGKGNIFGGKR